MSSVEVCQAMPDLKQIITEASRALALLDAARLEELAVCCRKLKRDLPGASLEARARLAHQAHESRADMAIYARVIEATRANLQVMHRLRELREGALEYGPVLAPTAEVPHGDN